MAHARPNKDLVVGDMKILQGNFAIIMREKIFYPSITIPCVAGHGCKWRGLPERFGNGHTVYTRMNRWSRNGVPDRVSGHLQREQVIRIRIEA